MTFCFQAIHLIDVDNFRDIFVRSVKYLSMFRRSLTCLTVFEYFILLAIGANCIVLALSTPLPKNDRTDLSVKLVSDWKFRCLLLTSVFCSLIDFQRCKLFPNSSFFSLFCNCRITLNITSLVYFVSKLSLK